MQLVILAAGYGRRFGGLKQLAPIGPDGEAIMDYTASAALASGFDGVVLVVRDEIREEVLAHVRRRWPAKLAVETVCQQGVPGTVQAVLCAAPAIEGSFGVANADDLYGTPALEALAHELAGQTTAPHCLVAYRLANTVINEAPVTRGIVKRNTDGELAAIIEHVVARQHDGSFEVRPLAEPDADLSSAPAHSLVSMNLWAFAPSMLGHLERGLERFDPSRAPRPECILPDVVNHVVSSGCDRVGVIETSERCIGVTHQDDVAIVREQIARSTRPDGAPVHSP